MTSPMRGWVCFGVVGGQPLNPGIITRELGGDEDWPDGELHNGVATVLVQTWADDLTGATLKVIGSDREAVEARWHIVAEALQLDGWWA